MAQTYKNFEIILVDNGSPDLCAQYCDEFALLDSRVKAFHKENGGVSSACNVEIENACGDYICFVDNDDTIPQDSLEKRLLAVEKYKTQYAAGTMITNGRIPKIIFNCDTVIDFEKEPEKLLSYITKPSTYSACVGVFKKEILLKNDIRFNEDIKVGEDALF